MVVTAVLVMQIAEYRSLQYIANTIIAGIAVCHYY